MHEAPRPSVAVVEDPDWPNCIGAFRGEISTAVHRGLGGSGAVTNGVVRDTGNLPPGFPVIAGGVGPSHGFVHVRTFGQPVRVMGLEVRPGDLIHADRHGAVVIPPEVIAGLAGAIGKRQADERLVLVPARQPGFDFAAFKAARAAFENART